jgi:hypothetical protein
LYYSFTPNDHSNFRPADSDSSSENENNDDVDKAGAYSVNEMYNFNRNDELDFHQTSMQNTSLNFSDSRNAPTPGWSQGKFLKWQPCPPLIVFLRTNLFFNNYFWGNFLVEAIAYKYRQVIFPHKPHELFRQSIIKR